MIDRRVIFLYFFSHTMFGSKKNLLRKIVGFCALLLVLFVINFLQGAIDRENPVQEQFISSFTEGEEHLSEGQFDKALASFETSLNIAKIGGNERGEIECYKRIGLIFWNLGQLDK